jgi:uncharacterized peroxidase-related enzyme
LGRDYRTAELSAPDAEMLSYVAKLTRAPHSVASGDVQRLRDVGFDDTAILDICQVTSYFNYVNRLADGLGVELEDSWTDEALTIGREEFDARVAARHESTSGEGDEA